MVHMWCSYCLLHPCSVSAPSLLPSFPSSASSEVFSDARTRKSLYGQVALTRQVVPYSASLAACPTLPPVLACGMPRCWAGAGGGASTHRAAFGASNRTNIPNARTQTVWCPTKSIQRRYALPYDEERSNRVSWVQGGFWLLPRAAPVAPRAMPWVTASRDRAARRARLADKRMRPSDYIIPSTARAPSHLSHPIPLRDACVPRRTRSSDRQIDRQ